MMLRMKCWDKSVKNRLLYISVAVITFLALVTGIFLVHLYSVHIVRHHVYGEMKTTTATQAEIIKREIKEQFNPLNALAEYLNGKDSFLTMTGQPILNVLKTENRFCTLGFADLSGEAIDCDGKRIGNISERAYFTQIIRGEKEAMVEYLSTTKRAEEPRFLFSVPVYDNEKIVGVLFASKKVSVLSDVLLGDTLFDGSERIFITDADFHVLAANQKGREEMEKQGFSDVYRFVPQNDIQSESQEDLVLEDEVYVVNAPVRINAWQMVCMLDRANAENVCQDITQALKRVANGISILLTAVLLYTVLLTQRRISYYRTGEQQMFDLYSSYRALLERMNCAVVEYRIQDDTLMASDFFMRTYAGGETGEQTLTMQKLQEIHPEFNFQELEDAIQLVLKKKRPCTLESAITLMDGKVYWVEITAIPRSDLSGHITDILAAVIDTTRVHESSNSVEVISNTPNGIHRCYLSDPIHLEFASKGMCQMLGYTEVELLNRVTPERKLVYLVHPEDREMFAQFIRNAAKSEGRYRCEYRMQKKDGSIISVLDNMEVKKAASGVMYGYSSVTDITEFLKAEELARARLRNAREEIEKHIAREQKIIADKKRAEEEFQKEALRLLEKSRITQMEANRLVRAISSINSDYSAIYFVDLDLDQYQLCKTTEMLRQSVYELVHGQDCFSLTIHRYIARFVAKEDRIRMDAATEIESIKDHLLRENQYFIRYRLTENRCGQVHYEMHIVDCSDEEHGHKVAVGFRCLDAAIAEEKKHQQEMEELEERLRSAQLKNSMSQMQPHFLYNALASIREIVLEDPQYASDLIFDFSTHLRACIRAMSNDDLVPFAQELENINAYVSIEKMRFGEKLHTRFAIADRDFSIVPLSIQPLVENAIRHGIYERGAKGGTVTVATEQTETHHIVRVSDDGVGFDYEKIRQETEERKRDSTGLMNLIFRLKKIMNAEITVDSTPGVGTVVTIAIPKEQEGNLE